MSAETGVPEAAPAAPAAPVDATERLKGFRADIQGLRGFAVMLVVVEHVVGKPRGAFVGLEFFFVISGFLITGLLLREAEKTESVSIRAFYQRRIRRIFPAAMVALAATVIAAKLLTTTGRYDGIKTDAWWTLGFMANWHFIHDGTDYFHQTASSISPMRHYWSLSVEEQWYVVWPVVVLLVAAYTRRQIRRRAERSARLGGEVDGLPPSVSTRVGMIAATLMVVSFVYAVYASSTDPRAAYFSTFTRAWEIAVGALLAAFATTLVRIPVWARNVMGLLGILGIATSTVVLDADVGFPAPTGALPVLSAALVIAAGTGVTGVATTRVFSWRPLQYFGVTSYSLYLVHWPILIFVRANMAASGPAYYALIIGLMIVCTLLLHHLVEMPVLHSRFLLPRRPRTAPAGSHAAAVVPRGPSWAHAHNAFVCVGALGLVAALVVVGRVGGGSETPVSYQYTLSAIAHAQSVVDRDSGPDRLQAGLQKALLMKSYPSGLAPALGDIAAGEAPEFDDGARCLSPARLSDPTNCVYGPKDATKHAVIIGDSIAVSYMPGLIDALGPEGWTVKAIALHSCPAADVQMDLPYDRPGEKRCNTSHQDVYDAVNALHPDLVLIADSSSGIQRLKSGNRDAPAEAEWQAAEMRTLKAVSAPGRDVIILGPNPNGPDPATCVTRFSKPKSCVTHPQTYYFSKRNAEKAAAHAEGARYINTIDWFCYHSKCPIFALGLTMRWDGSHITWAYAQMLAGRMRRAILDPVDPTGSGQGSTGGSGGSTGGSGQTATGSIFTSTPPAGTTTSAHAPG